MMWKHKSPYKFYFALSSLLFLVTGGFLIWLFWWLQENDFWQIDIQEKFWWLWLGWYLLTINLTEIILYFIDKIISIFFKQLLRVPELVLHIVALLGGSPMALVSQKLFRHKTSKTGFRVIYWLIVLAQIVVTAWFFVR